MQHQGQQGYATNHVDQYGNPVAVPGATGGVGAPAVPAAGVGHGGQFQPGREGHKTGGILHRSGSSSSSSSSEDDGMGGRRKKGIKQKIKEKLPGANKGQQLAPPTAPAGAYGQQGHAGMTGTGAHETMPAGGTYGQQGHAGITGTGAHGTAAAPGTYAPQQGHTGVTGTVPQGTYGTAENKGIMEKIKEKIPGGRKDQTMATGGAYGQPGHTGMTGTGAPTATGGAYGQPGHAGMTGAAAHGNTATGGAYGQQGHTGVTGTGTHGTTGTGGTYGQQGLAGTTATGVHPGEKKGIMEKMPGQHRVPEPL